MKQFTIFAPRLKTEQSDGKRRLHGIASSTVKDRHGDVITPKALSKMEQSATGMTIFFNHSYNVPEDVAGTVEKAIIRQHPTDPDIHDLVFDIVLNETNPRAIQSWEAQSQGTQLGLSIGARIPEGGATRDAEGVYTIDDIELLETSIVGVPASPRSWVDYAVKALRKSATETGEVSEEAGDEVKPEDVEETPTVELASADAESAPEASPDPDAEEEPANDPYDEPEVRFNSDAPQDAPEESNPETGEHLQSEDEETSAYTAALAGSADSLKTANEVIVSLNRELDVAKTEKRAAEEVSREVVSITKQSMQDTADLLTRLSETPQGRKTSPVVEEVKDEFDGLAAVYNKRVMALLNKEH